jgi:hypothetical protein
VVFTEHNRRLAAGSFYLEYYIRSMMMTAREHKPKRGTCLGGDWSMKSLSRALWGILSASLEII